MKTSPIVKMLVFMLVLGFFIAPIAGTLPPTDFYHQHRQFVTIEITKLDNTKVDLGVSFMAVELEQNAYLGQSVLVGIAAKVTSSSVTNFTTSDIVCLLFDQYFNPFVQVTDTLLPISINNTGIEIYAVGCGTLGSLGNREVTQQQAKERSLEQRTDCWNCSPARCIGRIWTCVFSVFIRCPSNPPVC